MLRLAIAPGNLSGYRDRTVPYTNWFKERQPNPLWQMQT